MTLFDMRVYVLVVISLLFIVQVVNVLWLDVDRWHNNVVSLDYHVTLPCIFPHR
jgi:hypothetical protein